jgi:hypothetical protein
MSITNESKTLKSVEAMIIEEMDQCGRIYVRSLDRIHARTGLGYNRVSEIARRVQINRYPKLTQ